MLHQQAGQRVILTLVFQRQRQVQHQIFQWHIAVSGPTAILILLDIMPGIHFLTGFRQVTGDGFHHIGQRDDPFHRAELIDHKGKMRLRLTELFQRAQQG
ncbi:hypothetical protein D3C80_1139840 [compost metagenome]